MLTSFFVLMGKISRAYGKWLCDAPGNRHVPNADITMCTRCGVELGKRPHGRAEEPTRQPLWVEDAPEVEVTEPWEAPKTETRWVN